MGLGSTPLSNISGVWGPRCLVSRPGCSGQWNSGSDCENRIEDMQACGLWIACLHMKGLHL